MEFGKITLPEYWRTLALLTVRRDLLGKPLDEGVFGEARKYAQKAVDLQPDVAENYSALGNVQSSYLRRLNSEVQARRQKKLDTLELEQRKRATAEEVYKFFNLACQIAGSGDANFRMNRGTARYYLFEPPDDVGAEEDLKYACEKMPDSSIAFFNYAFFLRTAKKDLPAAETKIEQAVKDPKLLSARLEQVLVLFEAANHFAAREKWAALKDHAPDFVRREMADDPQIAAMAASLENLS